MPWTQLPKQDRPQRPPRVAVPTVRIERPRQPPSRVLKRICPPLHPFPAML